MIENTAEYSEFLAESAFRAENRLWRITGGQPVLIGSGSSPARAARAISGSALGWALQCEAAYPSAPGASRAAVERRARAFAGMVLHDIEREAGLGAMPPLSLDQPDESEDGPALGDVLASPDDTRDALEAHADLTLAVQRLPEDQRAVFQAHLAEGLPFAEVAARLRISRITAVRRYQVARKAVQQFLRG